MDISTMLLIIIVAGPLLGFVIFGVAFFIEKSKEALSEASLKKILKLCRKKFGDADNYRLEYYYQEYSFGQYKYTSTAGLIDHSKFLTFLAQFKSSEQMTQLSEKEMAQFLKLERKYLKAKKVADIAGKISFAAGGGSSKASTEWLAGANVAGVSEKAKADMRKEAGKKAAKEVIKGAVVGGIVAGDAGAVVGATAAKAKLDAEQQTGSSSTAGKDAAKGVVKGAVIGAVIGGDAGAVIGATAAKAKANAQDSKK